MGDRPHWGFDGRLARQRRRTASGWASPRDPQLPAGLRVRLRGRRGDPGPARRSYWLATFHAPASGATSTSTSAPRRPGTAARSPAATVRPGTSTSCRERHRSRCSSTTRTSSRAPGGVRLPRGRGRRGSRQRGRGARGRPDGRLRRTTEHAHQVASRQLAQSAQVIRSAFRSRRASWPGTARRGAGPASRDLEPAGLPLQRLGEVLPQDHAGRQRDRDTRRRSSSRRCPCDVAEPPAGEQREAAVDREARAAAARSTTPRRRAAAPGTGRRRRTPPRPIVKAPTAAAQVRPKPVSLTTACSSVATPDGDRDRQQRARGA